MKTLTLLPILFACSGGADAALPTQPVAAPENLTVRWERGPVAADEGAREFIELAPLDRTQHTFTITRGTVMRGTGTQTSRKVIDGAAASSLYTVIVDVDFIALDPEYSDPDTRDGATSSLTVRGGYFNHTVQVSNVSVPSFGSVVVALHSL